MALSACGLAIFELLSAHEADLPRLPLELVGPAAAALAEALAAALACVALAKATVLRGSLHFEWHRGQLHVQLGVPSSGPSMPQGAVQVQPTTDGRGNGAFAALPIPKGCHICDYEGQLLTPQQFFARYPDGVGDFTTDLGDCLIDASHLVGQTSTFSAVHMNSSRVRPNVVRFFDRGARRVAFFASRDIAVGEELLYDYGRRYWATREHLEKA